MSKIFSKIRKWRASFVLLVILSSFLAIVFSTISKASIWFDEAFSAYIIRFSFADIWHYTSVDVHPPLYYFCLKIWSLFFGKSDLALRSMSAVFGVLTILAAYLLVKRLFNKKTALILSGLLAISPMLIRYSQEARMYTMVAFLGVVAVRAFYEGWMAKNDTKIIKRWRFIYVLAVCLGIWTQYLYGLIPVSLWIYRVFSVCRRRELERKKTWFQFLRIRKNQKNSIFYDFFSEGWFKTHLIIAILYLPWIPFFIAQTAYVKEKFWIPAIDFSTIPNMISNFLFYLDVNKTNGWLSIVAVSIIVIAFFAIKRELKNKVFEKNIQLILSIAIIPVIVLYVASLPPLSSIFVDRYLLMAEIFISIALAVAIYYNYKNKKIFMSLLLGILVTISHSIGVFQIDLQRGVSKNDGEITEIRQAIEQIRNENRYATIAVGDFLYYSAAQYSTSDSKVWFYGEAPIYGSGDMIRSDFTPKIEKYVSFLKENKEFYVIEKYINNEDTAPSFDKYKLSNEEFYNNSIDGKPLYRIFKFVAK